MVKHCLSPEPSRLVLSVVLGGCCSKGKQNANTFNLLSDSDSTVQKRYNLGSWEQMTDRVFSSIAHHLILGDGMSHWTQSSLIWLAWWA